MNLKAKQNAVVSLIKKESGEKFENLGAIVLSDVVFLLDVSNQPQKGDTILVQVPNGSPETLTVVTSIYKKRETRTMAHYYLEISR